MRTNLSIVVLGLTLVVSGLDAQTAPVVVPAATPASAPAAQAVQAPQANSASAQAAVKMLSEMKAANDETLRKQQATLQQLDELQKAAEQIKIYTKRS